MDAIIAKVKEGLHDEMLQWRMQQEETMGYSTSDLLSQTVQSGEGMARKDSYVMID
jgi:hypothetical protein